MKIETIYDPGTTKILEDQIIFRLPFVGVVDGVSGVYHPSTGPTLFEGRSGGRMVADSILETFASVSLNLSLTKTLVKANLKIQEKQKPLNLYESSYGFYGTHKDTSRTDLLAGASFACAKIGEKTVEIIQGGDSFAVWKTYLGKVSATKNQVFAHDMELLNIVAKLMLKYGSDRNKMWQEYIPILAEAKRKHTNKPIEKCGYAELNGQSSVYDYWKRIVITRSRLSLLLLFTDGLVHYPDTGDEQALAKMVLEYYYQGGLDLILKQTRQLEEKEKEKTHIDHAEATGLAIEF